MNQADLFDGAEVISRYTREQALADGVLVDVTDIAGQNGFRVPVALTAAVWAACTREEHGPAALRERLRDICWMASLRIHAAIRNADFAGHVLDSAQPFRFSVVIWRTSFRLWIVFNPAEGFTIGFPEDF